MANILKNLKHAQDEIKSLLDAEDAEISSATGDRLLEIMDLLDVTRTRCLRIGYLLARAEKVSDEACSAILELLNQATQMKPLFKDEDGQIGEAIEGGRVAMRKLREWQKGV